MELDSQSEFINDYDSQIYSEIWEPLGSLEVLGDMMEMDTRPNMAERVLFDVESDAHAIRELGTQTILSTTSPPAFVSA